MTRRLPIAEFHSELAYDALLDALSLANRLAERPRTYEELRRLYPDVPAETLDRQLRRLIRSGIVRERDGRYEAASSVIATQSQGGPMGPLSELFIPAVMSVVFEPGQGLLLHLNLRLDPALQERLETDFVRPLHHELADLVQESNDDTHERFVIVAGTPTALRGVEGLERALEVLRHAARDRVDPRRRSLSLLSYVQGRFFRPEPVLRAVVEFEKRLEAFRAGPNEEANYSLLIGTGSRSRSLGALR